MLLSSDTGDTIAELITGKLPNSRVFVERDQKVSDYLLHALSLAKIHIQASVQALTSCS